MSRRSLIAAILATAVVTAIVSVSVTRLTGQSSRPARTADGKPNISGVWQVNNEANWDLQAHDARPGAVTQRGIYPYAYAEVPAAPVLALGAAGIVPASIGVVQGDKQIPYIAAAASRKTENGAHWVDRDPELKCYLPGIPRATYMPHPFQIVQSSGTNDMLITYEFASASRIVRMNSKADSPIDTWMGWSRGSWDGDTLVVDVTSFNGQAWFDRAGNYQSDRLHVVERYTPIGPDAFRYEATIDDPTLYSRPWKISMPIYRRLEKDAQLVEYKCVEFVEELMYGEFVKKPRQQTH